jgi:hypothetical protein
MGMDAIIEGGAMLLECKNGHGPLQPNLSMSGDHIKASCFICDCYIKFVPYKDLDEGDLANLKAWQEAQVADQCDYTHDDYYVMLDEFDSAFRVFNYCPGCGIKLKEVSDGKSQSR